MATPNTPSWLVPSTVGQTSNHKAANTGADLVVGKVKFSSPVAGAFPASIRIVGQRTVLGGIPQNNPNNLWDTTWVGNYATSPFPVTLSMGANAAVTVANRVYVVTPTTFPYGAGNAATGAQGIVATMYSAPINGMNIGSWRLENPVQPLTVDAQGQRQPTYDSCNPGAIASINGILFVLGQKAIYKCPLNADGSLGTWTVFAPTGSGAGATMCGWGGANNGGLVIVYQHASNSTINVFNMDGQGNFVAPSLGSTLGVGRQWGACFIDPNSFFYFVGGEDGAGNAVANTYYATINLITGTLGAITGGQALPLARSRFGFMYVFSPSAFWAGGSPPGSATESSFAVVGGQAGNGGAGTAVSTIYQTIGTSLRTAAVWGTYTGVLPNPQKGCCAAATGATGSVAPPSPGAPIPGSAFAPTSALSYDPTVDATNPDQALICIGGSATTDVQTARITDTGFRRGASSVITTAILGTGSAVTANADGSYNLTFPIGGAAVAGLGVAMGASTLVNGDWLQLYVQVADGLTGDVSTSLPTIVKIGQPPTLSAIAPSGTITNGQPTASFGYSAGAGGGGEYSYQIQVKQGATVLFDTGLRYDNLNSALLTIAPLLTPSTTYTNGLIITATSSDNPISGATNTVTSTTSFTTSAFSVLGAPGSFTATPSQANGNIALAWGAVGSATGYRVYYRRNGTSVWYLLNEPGNVTSYTAMDAIALGVGYDFQVSTLSAVPAESAVSSVQSNISIPLGAYSAFLHVAGSGTGVPFQIQGTPTVTSRLAATSLLGFGQAAPITRYGTADYKLIAATATLFDATTATLKILQAIIDSVRLGGVCCYRDPAGAMLYGTFDTDQVATIKPPYYRDVQFKFTEVANLVGPYVSSGSAQGYLTLVNGRKPVLDLSEALL